MLEESLLLIDGNSVINRAFFALPPLTNPKGEPVQAVFGFTNMLIRAIAELEPKYMAVAFDLPAPTFRHKMYDGYKATRRRMPDELASQLPMLKRLLNAMNVTTIEKEGFEADDIIGTLARKFGVRTYIITGDRDSFQLVSDKVRVVFTRRGLTDTLTVDPLVLKNEYGLTPDRVVDYKALAGDASDNIPGVPGVGDKKALSLLDRFGSMHGVYDHLGEITGRLAEILKEGKESAELSYKLAQIRTDVPLDVALRDLTFSFPFPAEVRAFFVENKFRLLLRREDIFAADGPKITPAKHVEFKSVTLSSPGEIAEAVGGAEKIAFTAGEDAFRFSTDGRTEYILPIMQTLVDDGVTYDEGVRAFAPYFAAEKPKKILYDAKRLHRTLGNIGATLQNYDDVKLMQYVVDMRVMQESFGDFVAGAGYDRDFPAAALFHIAEELDGELDGRGMRELYERAELPLVSVLYDMEERGVKVNLKLLGELGEKFSAQTAELENMIYRLAGRKFNLNSPKQLAGILFDELGIEYPGRGSKHSTSADILSEIMDAHEIVPLITKFRLIAKLNSTYIEGIKRMLAGGDVIHTDYKQMLTTTGRLSSAEPNLQNIPVREDEGKILRGLFVAREGYTLVSADYSQIELRLLAHFSADPRLIEMYGRGEDIHALTASQVFGVPLGEVTKDQRREAKTVNFGIIYGISDFGLSRNLHCSLMLARQYMDAYFKSFPGIKSYFENVVEEARKNGYTRSLLGRIRYIPELASQNYATRQFGERAARNMPLQASAADIIKLAMVDVAHRLSGLNARLILQIHDELIVEARDDEVDKVKEILRDCMENAVSLRVPLTVDISSGKSWLDCQEGK